MKVRDLIEKLNNVDPEAEVRVAPLKIYPMLNDDSFETFADPENQFPIGMVGEYQDMRGGPGETAVVLGFDLEARIDGVRDMKDELVN